MRAFNARFSPKEWGGFPRAVVIGAVGCLVSAVLALVMPSWVKVLAVPGLLVSIWFTVQAFILGDHWEFRQVMAVSRRDAGCVTSDTWTVD